MSQEKFDRSKFHVNVGTIGPLGHGKTTLTAAILKVQHKNNLATAISYAEIAKGGTVVDETRIITVLSSDVEYESSMHHYGHIDCPGDSKYTRNLFDGVAQMDVAILVVSALDSMMIQTQEHLILARQAAGVNDLIVFLNKCDAVDDDEKLDFIELEIRELLNKYKFDGDNAPVIRGAALPALEGDSEWEKSIHKLLDAMDTYYFEPTREFDRPGLMSVANVFTTEKGTVARGRIEQGKICINGRLELIGTHETKETDVIGLQMFGKILDEGQAGDLVTCLLPGIDIEEINRGQVLAKPGAITLHTKFQAEVYVLTEEEGGRQMPFVTGCRPQFYIGTADVTGHVDLPEGMEMAMPGDNANMIVELVAPIYLKEQMRFAIREADKTVGAGAITQILR